MERLKSKETKAAESGNYALTASEVETQVEVVKGLLGSDDWTPEDIRVTLQKNLYDIQTTLNDLLDNPPQWKQVPGKRTKAENKPKSSSSLSSSDVSSGSKHFYDANHVSTDSKQFKSKPQSERRENHDKGRGRGGGRGRKKSFNPRPQPSQPALSQQKAQESHDQHAVVSSQPRPQRTGDNKENAGPLAETRKEVSAKSTTQIVPSVASSSQIEPPKDKEPKKKDLGDWRNKLDLQGKKRTENLSVSSNGTAKGATVGSPSISVSVQGASSASSNSLSAQGAPVGATSTAPISASPSQSSVATLPSSTPTISTVSSKSYHPPGMVWKPKETPTSSSATVAKQIPAEPTPPKVMSSVTGTTLPSPPFPNYSLSTSPVILPASSAAVIDTDVQDFTDVQFGNFASSGTFENQKSANASSQQSSKQHQGSDTRDQGQLEPETSAELETHAQLPNPTYSFIPPGSFFPTYPPFAYESPDANGMRPLPIYEQPYQQPPQFHRETSPVNDSSSFTAQRGATSNQSSVRDPKFGQETNSAPPSTQPTTQPPFAYSHSSRHIYAYAPYQFPSYQNPQHSQYGYPPRYYPAFPNYPNSSSFPSPSNPPSTSSYPDESLMQDYSKNMFPPPYYMSDANMIGKSSNQQTTSPPPGTVSENPQYKSQQTYSREIHGSPYYNIPQQYPQQTPSNFSFPHLQQQSHQQQSHQQQSHQQQSHQQQSHQPQYSQNSRGQQQNQTQYSNLS